MTRPARRGARPSPMTLCGMLALLAALLVLALAFAPRAEAFVYWTNLAHNTIGRANLDGTGVDQSFIKTPVGAGLAVDGAHVYWSFWGTTNQEPYNGRIGRANLDGTGVDKSFIPNAGRPMSVAVDAAHVYWPNAGRTNQNPYGDTIMRASLDGLGLESFFIGPSHLTGWLAVAAEHVYWVDTYGGAAIDRANLDGTGVEQGFISAPSFYPSGLAVDAEHIYWASAWNRTIGRADLDGTDVEHDFITEAGLPGTVAVDAGHIYWTNGGVRIARANLDGSNVDPDFINTGLDATSIAVDFSLGANKNKRRGTAELTLEVPAPGTLALTQTKKVKGAGLRAEAAGEVTLPIKPRGKAKKKLAEHGKVKVGVEVTYTPDGGEPEAQVATLRLKR